MSPFSEVVTAALIRELTRRRRLDPRAQLGLSTLADSEDIVTAFAQLWERYDPLRFESYGPAAVDAARSICVLLDAARGLLLEASEEQQENLVSGPCA